MQPGDVPPEPRVMPSLRQAWANLRPWWGPILLLHLVTWLATALAETGRFGFGPPIVATSIGAAALAFTFLVLVPLNYGINKAHLRVTANDRPQWDDLLHGFRFYGQAVLLGLLVALAVIVGLVLLILPGLYIAVRLSFTAYRFVTTHPRATDAMRASFEDTKGRFWPVAGLAALSALIVIVGLLLLIVGVFPATILVTQMAAVYWRSLYAQANPAPPTAAPAAPAPAPEPT